MRIRVYLIGFVNHLFYLSLILIAKFDIKQCLQID